MVYFYSAILYTEKGKGRVDGAVEIAGGIPTSKIWYEKIQKELKNQLCSDLKENKGIDIESSSITFISFNPI